MAVFVTTNGDVILRGSLLELVGLFVNADINAGAAIAASKCQRGPVLNVFQSGGAASETIFAFRCLGATATLKQFTVTNVVACSGSSTITVDLKKNGTTVLSAVVTLSSATVAYSENNGTLSTVALVDGDYLTVVITATASGTDALGSGVQAQIELDYDYLA